MHLAQANTHMLAVWTPNLFYKLQFFEMIVRVFVTLMIEVWIFFFRGRNSIQTGTEYAFS